jgi:glyceraldehyde-3-phosphate dehydrogenase/erythrose-4-phosphate dehydrogenase
MAVNDLTDAKTNAHLFKWDSIYGGYPGEVSAAENAITVVDGQAIKVCKESDPPPSLEGTTARTSSSSPPGPNRRC